MAGNETVSKMLNLPELESLPPEIVVKLENHFGILSKELDDLKTTHERLKVNSEQKYFDIEKQLVSTKGKLETEKSSNVQLIQRLTDLEEKYDSASKKLKEVEDTQDNTLSTQLRLSRENERLENEKRDLTLLLDRKTKEIDRLNDEWKDLTAKLAKANTEKCEAQAKYSELQSQTVTSEYRQKRLEQEKEQALKQVEFLNKEVGDKSKELMTLRKQQSSKLLETESQLEKKMDELKHLTNTVEQLKKTNTDQASRIDNLIEKLKQERDSQTQSEEQFNQELRATTRLTDLYKKSTEEADSKVNELTSAVAELQRLLKEAAQAYSDLEKDKKDEETNLKADIQQRDARIEDMKQELVNANELLKAAKCKELSEEQVESLFPTAAATSKVIASGLSLTQIYNEYIKATDCLIVEKDENKRLNSYLDQILQEIEEKAPLLTKQREDYENLLQTNEQLTRQMDAAMLECQNLRLEASDYNRKYNHMQRENQKLHTQTQDLSRQVQFLVKEIQEARGGRVVQEDDVSSAEVTSSSQVITEKLVTFRDIQHLQVQNQNLLAAIRELSDKKEEEEKEATESKTKDLREQLDRALVELQEMRSARERQAEMVEAIVRQRDLYRVLLQEGPQSPSASLLTPAKPGTLPSPKGGIKSPSSLSADLQSQLQEAKTSLKHLQDQYDNYKKEKSENERMLNDQIDKSRNDLSNMRVQNAKLASQLDYSGERFKVLQSNADGYKKEIASLQDKVQKYSTSLAKHEQTINTLRQEALSSQEKLARAEAQSQNLRTECELLKTSERRILEELESSRRERHSQSTLMANLQAIQNNLERSEFEAKNRTKTRVEALEREVNTLKRNLKAEKDEHEAVKISYQAQIKKLKSQLEQEMKNHQDTKNKLNDASNSIQQLNEQISTLESKLSAAEIRLSSAPSTANGVDALVNKEQIKDLRSELETSEREKTSLKEQLENVKQHLNQYKVMADGLQKTVSESSQVSHEVESKFSEINKEKDRLVKKIEDLEKERENLVNENIRVSEESHNLNTDLRKQLTSLQNELQEAVQRREAAIATEVRAKDECQKQIKLASEAQDKYQRELMLHAADMEALTTVKKQLESFNERLSVEQESRLKAEQKLEENKNSWSKQEGLLKKENERLEKACKEYRHQNMLLHTQMEKLSKDVAAVNTYAKRDAAAAADSSKAGEALASKSSDQLLEIIRFLRKEKEIAETKLEVVQAECSNVKQRSGRLANELDEAMKVLTDERERSQTTLQTAAQHAELMKKVENLNLLTDSNKLLRDENTKLTQQVAELDSKVKKLEGDINPLQANIRDLQAQKDALGAEKTALLAEVDRWKNRTNLLIEQTNKSDPEEHTRLVQAREALRKDLSSLREELHKVRTENSRLSNNLGNSQSENVRLNSNLGNVQSENARLNVNLGNLQNENSKLNSNLTNMQNENSKLNSNLTNLQNELDSTKQEVEKLSEEVNNINQQMEEKNKDVEEKQKTILQLKKIGRKYKEQAETVGKELEELKVSTETQQQQQQQQQARPPSEEVIEQALAPVKEQLGVVEKERDDVKSKLSQHETDLNNTKEQLEKVNQEFQQQQEAVNKLKEENTEYERKQNQSKNVLQAAKKKIGAQNEQIEKLENELKDVKQKVTSADKSSSGEADARVENFRAQYENQIKNMEKELSEAKARAAAVNSSNVVELKDNIEKLKAENAELQSKIQQLQKQIESQPKPVPPQPQVARPSQTTERSSVSATEAPKTANIRPMASPATGRQQVAPQIAQPSAAAKVTASIRPMAIAPTSVPPISVSVATPTATVMPTTVTQQDLQETGESGGAQLSPVTGTARPTQQVQRVNPQVDTAPDQGGQLESVVPPMNQAEVEPQPSTSVSRDEQASQSQLGKRVREDESESQEDESDAKRSRFVSQDQATIPSITVTDEHANTTPVSTDEQPTDLSRSTEDSSTRSVLPQDSQTSVTDQSSFTAIPSTVESESQSTLMPSSSEDYQVSQDQVKKETGPDEDDGSIIILESDEEDEQGEDEDYTDDEDEDEEEEEEDEDEDEEGGENMEEYEDDEGQDEPIQDEPYMVEADMEEEESYPGDDNVMQEGTGYDAGDQQDMQQEAPDTYDDGDDVVIVDDDNEEAQMEDAQDESAQSSAPSITTSAQVIGQRPLPPLQQIERQTSVTRAQLTPFVLGGQAGAFEDGEDGIVPSTPTLFVPHRGDGFAEAVSSPQIPNQRFLFGASAESGTELAQLESQALRLDDTRMDLSQLDEGTGRSVPTTPLRTTAPVMFTASEARDTAPILIQATAAILSSQQTTEAETGETQTSDRQSPTEGVEEIEGDLGEEDAAAVAALEEESEEASGDKTEPKEGTEAEGETVPKDEDDKTASQDKSDSDKPKIQKIVWAEDGGPATTSSAPQQGHSPNPVVAVRVSQRPSFSQRGMQQQQQHRGGMQQMRGGMQQMRGSVQQHRGRGNFPRGRSPIPRGRGGRGGRGGYQYPFL